MAERLNLTSDEFKEVSSLEFEAICKKIWTEYSRFSDNIWIWETFNQAYTSIEVKQNSIYLEELIASEEKVWFLPNDGKKVWVYATTAATLNKLLEEEVFIHEFIIVSKKYEWLLVLNHHNTLFALGTMRKRLQIIS
jgi:hypothetical protein